MATREEKKVIAVEQAKFRLKQRLERIDFNEDVILPLREGLRRELGNAIVIDAELCERTEGEDH